MNKNMVKLLLLVLILLTFHFHIIQQYKHAKIELKMWTKKASKNISHYINFEQVKEPQNFCRWRTKLLVMVFSTPSNFEARTAIRKYWGNREKVLKPLNVSLYFLMGLSLNESVRGLNVQEQAKFSDILVQDFVDNYINLTLKSVVMVKMFASQTNCELLLKADEDVYVNIAQIVHQYIETTQNKPDVLIGRLLSGIKRETNAHKLYYSPSYMYLKREYPKFVAGPAYLISKTVSQKLYKAALKTPLFHLEDVYLTGICSDAANVTRENDFRFTDYGIPFRKCELLKLFTVHSFVPSRMSEIERLISVLKKTCRS